MNITDLKAQISATANITLPTLDLHAQKDEAGVINPDWVSHWDDTNRVRITMHMDIVKKLQANKMFDGLAVKKMEVKQPADATKPTYRLFTVITPQLVASF